MTSNHALKRAGIQELKIGYGEAAPPEPIDMATGVLWIVVPYTSPELTRAAVIEVQS